MSPRFYAKRESAARTYNAYNAIRSETRGCRAFKRDPPPSHPFFLCFEGINWTGIEFDPNTNRIESKMNSIRQGRFSRMLNQGLIRTRNNEIGSIARQEQQRDRGAKMTSGGNSGAER